MTQLFLGTDNAGNRNNILFAPVSKPTAIEESTDTRPEQESTSQPAEMDHSHSDEIEERMGTREPSDVLFDDEIVKDSEDISTSPVFVPVNGHENWAPPSPKRTESNTAGAQKGYLALLDAAGPEEAEQEQKSHEARDTHKTNIKKEDHTEIRNIAEDKGLISNGNAHETKPPNSHEEKGKSVLTDTPAVNVEEVSIDKDLILDSLTKRDGIIPSLSIKELDAEDDGSAEATHSEPEQGSEPGYIMVDEANTAAEVADVAAELDLREPTPPISDEEAGRIGYRRMSNTPIPQVAATAAEVADVARLLDDENSMDSSRVSLAPCSSSVLLSD